jgi:hypothetical protein
MFQLTYGAAHRFAAGVSRFRLIITGGWNNLPGGDLDLWNGNPGQQQGRFNLGVTGSGELVYMHSIGSE